ncbi:MAG: NAD(P)-binding domain-containing protein [Nitrospira sp.]|nr:NAD(P)-binding domain-containing protein [Nitrospira sp.]
MTRSSRSTPSIKAGFKLQVYNRTAEKAAGLVAQGARLVCQPGDAAEPGGIAITVLADDRALVR